MLKIDSKRLSKEQMTKGPGKDYFLVEVKGFDKQTSQKPEVDGNADKHEFVLICPQGSGKPSGKRVQLNQKVSSRDYMIQENMMNNMVENDNYMQSKFISPYSFEIKSIILKLKESPIFFEKIYQARFFTHDC